RCRSAVPGCGAGVRCRSAVPGCGAGVGSRSAMPVCGVGVGSRSAVPECGVGVRCRSAVPEFAAGVRCRSAVPECGAGVRCRSAVPECGAGVRCRSAVPECGAGVRCRSAVPECGAGVRCRSAVPECGAGVRCRSAVPECGAGVRCQSPVPESRAGVRYGSRCRSACRSGYRSVRPCAPNAGDAGGWRPSALESWTPVPSALRRQIGQLLIAGFNGQQIPPELRSLAKEFGLGGVILFARNVGEAEQVAELAFEAARLVPDLPVWVSVDQEGGRVARLKAPFTEWPPMATLGRAGDVRLAERFARALAAEIRAVGITLDYAPVLDVHTNPKNPVIGDRALAERAAEVARIGAAIIRAMQDEHVAACGKHFPGHGDTSKDSHLELPLVEQPPERLRELEFLPFRAAIEAQVATIMTAHVLVPALDEERPATLSPRIVGDILRGELKYDGVILSDDLEMKALANDYAVPAA